MKGLPTHILLLWVAISITQTAIIPNNQPIQTTPITTQDPLKCQKTTYTSMFTMCEINFDFCNSTTFKFLKCYKKQCERFIRGSQCRLWTRLQLNQNQCYKQCCGSNKFQEVACNNYNNKKQQTQTTITGALISIIVVSSLILIGVAAFLLIKVQKCCQKTSFKKISKYNILWRNQKVTDSICQICDSYGAFVQTPCDHHFHASCFEENAKQNDFPLCPKCGQKIRQRLKISCFVCKEKVFKIKLWRKSHLPQIMKQARALHDGICSHYYKSDQNLLSPFKN